MFRLFRLFVFLYSFVAFVFDLKLLRTKLFAEIGVGEAFEWKLWADWTIHCMDIYFHVHLKYVAIDWYLVRWETKIPMLLNPCEQ